MGCEEDGTDETHRQPSTNHEETHYERRWAEGDSGRSKKQMGVDTGGQSAVSVCETEGRSEASWTFGEEESCIDGFSDRQSRYERNFSAAILIVSTRFWRNFRM
jgi:hypothetical protein